MKSIVGRRPRAVEGAIPYGFVRFSVVDRGSRTAEDVGPYGLVRCSIVGRRSRAVEGASPYGFVRFSVVGRGYTSSVAYGATFPRWGRLLSLLLSSTDRKRELF